MPWSKKRLFAVAETYVSIATCAFVAVAGGITLCLAAHNTTAKDTKEATQLNNQVASNKKIPEPEVIGVSDNQTPQLNEITQITIPCSPKSP